ncbi:MFS transporter [Propionicicella superfundia]|uniref:MFS transporter n=1 Tax=Propionicicella superfundia TaxID=348582 RepID=UPI000569F0B7|nr:MFS transporter [Propionicicella superfundia]
MRASAATRGLLTSRPFVTLLAARTLSMLGLSFSPVALAFGVLALPHSGAGELSIVLASQMVPLVAFLLVGGVVADRYPRSRVLLAGALLSALAWGTIGLMFLSGWAPLWALCTAAAFAGLAGAPVYPALNGIIPDLVPVEHRQQGNAWLAMGASGARLAGLVAGGAMVVWLGGGWAMIAAGGMYLGAAILVSTLPRVADTLADSETSPLRQLIEGWSEFSSRRWLWATVAQWAVMIMVLQAANGVLGPVIAETELGGAGVWTTVLAAEALGAVVGVALSMVWHPRRPILAATLLTLSAGLPALLLGVSAPVWTVVAAAFVAGIGFDLFGVWWMTTMQDEVPAESLSRVASYDALGSLMLGPVGLALAGPAAVVFGAHASLVGAGLIALAATVFTLSVPEVRTLRARRHTVADPGDVLVPTS